MGKHRFSGWRLRRAVVLTAWWASALVGAGTAGGQSAEPVWTVTQADGSVVVSSEAPVWRQAGSPAQVSGRLLWSSGGFVRCYGAVPWDAGLPPSFVEMWNGDILPGVVRGYSPPDASLGLPARLSVELGAFLSGWDPGRRVVLVRADAVRRIVQGRSASPSSGAALGGDGGGVAVLADGRQVRLEAMRFSAEGVRLLGSEPTRVSWAELAELYLPGSPETQMSAALADLTAARQTQAGLVHRVVLRGGARLTFPAQSFLLDARQMPGERGRPQTLIVQPLWSLEALRTLSQSVVAGNLWRADELALDLLAARQEHRRWAVGGAHVWRRGVNLRGEPARVGSHASAMAIAMPADCVLVFDLPAAATGFFAVAGLDQAVGNGGCATLRIYGADRSGEPLWQSAFVYGSDRPRVVDKLRFPRDTRQITLYVDMAHTGRPESADPLDIRDEVSWLSPTVRFASLPDAGTPALADAHAVLQGWTWDHRERPGAAAADASAAPVADMEWVEPRGAWLAAWRAPARRVRLQRSIRLDADHAILRLVVGRTRGDVEHVVRVSVGSRTLDRTIETRHQRPGGMVEVPLALGGQAAGAAADGAAVMLTVEIEQTRGGTGLSGLLLGSLAVERSPQPGP